MEKHKADVRLVTGAILIVMGGLLLADIFDLFSFNFSYYIFSWKTLLIGLGLIALVSKQNYTVGLVLIFIGVFFWIPSIFDVDIRFGAVFWPMIFIGLGLIILSHRKRGGGSGQHHDKQGIHMFTDRSAEYNDDFIDELALFGGGNRIITSQNLKGGKITAIFGGSEFNFKQADFQDKCTIELLAIFGGTKLIVPDGWHVKSEVTALFGGFADKRMMSNPPVHGDKTLIIKGVVLFGGGEIKSY